MLAKSENNNIIEEEDARSYDTSVRKSMDSNMIKAKKMR